jgi:hypothetical protein
MTLFESAAASDGDEREVPKEVVREVPATAEDVFVKLLSSVQDVVDEDVASILISSVFTSQSKSYESALKQIRSALEMT